MPQRRISVILTHLAERNLVILVRRKSGLIYNGETCSKHKRIGGKKAVIPGGVCGCFWEIADDIDFAQGRSSVHAIDRTARLLT